MSNLREGGHVPSTPFPILPLRSGVLFPGTVITLPIGRERSLALVRTLRARDLIGVVTQRDPKQDEPEEADVQRIGTFARVVDVTRLPGGELRLSLEGLGRLRLDALVQTNPFWLASGSVAEELNEEVAEAKLLAQAL